MPLRRASSRFIKRRKAFHFLMKGDGREVICSVSERVLMALGETMGLRSPVYTFWAVRDEIERAASAKYDQTPRSDYEVIEIEERDLNISGAPRRAFRDVGIVQASPRHRR
jgi:hypothetical protein